MCFLSSADQEKLLKEAKAIQDIRKQDSLKHQTYIRDYYDTLIQYGLKAELRAGLGRIKDGTFQQFTPGTLDKVCQGLAKGEVSSEAAFMSFFHVVCEQFRAKGAAPPAPSEILTMQAQLFGRRRITTCVHNNTLLAYTLGFLQARELNRFNEEQMERMNRITGEKLSAPKQVYDATTQFEQSLNYQIQNMDDFRTVFEKRARLQTNKNWRDNLRRCMEDICKAHHWREDSLVIYMEENGCAHMKSELDKRVLNMDTASLPTRSWILSFCLYMKLTKEETNQLLRHCGLVNLGYEPWEAGLSYLLDHPAQSSREALDRREYMYDFLSRNKLCPPADTFAAFPYLAGQQNKGNRALTAALLLDCFAEISPPASQGKYRAVFHTRPAKMELPDYCAFFFPKRGCTSWASQLKSLLGHPLSSLDRDTQEYRNLSDRMKEWAHSWKPIEEETPTSWRVMWRFSDSLQDIPVQYNKLLYALLVYILYTGHLPLKNCNFHALPSHDMILAHNTCLEFSPSEEAETCQKMAWDVLSYLQDGRIPGR